MADRTKQHPNMASPPRPQNLTDSTERYHDRGHHWLMKDPAKLIELYFTIGAQGSLKKMS